MSEGGSETDRIAITYCDCYEGGTIRTNKI